MTTTGFIVAYLAFIMAGIVATIAQDRFFKAVERRQPGAVVADSVWANEVQENPARLPLIVFRVTLLRRRALARRSPYQEVERSRRWALISIALSIAAFIWILVGSNR